MKRHTWDYVCIFWIQVWTSFRPILRHFPRSMRPRHSCRTRMHKGMDFYGFLPIRSTEVVRSIVRCFGRWPQFQELLQDNFLLFSRAELHPVATETHAWPVHGDGGALAGDGRIWQVISLNCVGQSKREVRNRSISNHKSTLFLKVRCRVGKCV